MSAHLITDETATTTTLDPATQAGWLALSAAATEEAPLIADRDDLVVTVAPGAGRGSPACFFPPHAAIEVDGVHLPAGVDPATATPHRVGDRARYAAVWGLLVHECAHARHTLWDPPPPRCGQASGSAQGLTCRRGDEANTCAPAFGGSLIWGSAP